MTESQLQATCYTWFHNHYPHLRGLLCYNLNNSRNKIDGNMNRTLGLQAGRSDMVFYHQGKATMIELKTDTGSQSPAQRKWETLIRAQGFDYHVVRTFAEFQDLIKTLITP